MSNILCFPSLFSKSGCKGSLNFQSTPPRPLFEQTVSQLLKMPLFVISTEGRNLAFRSTERSLAALEMTTLELWHSLTGTREWHGREILIVSQSDHWQIYLNNTWNFGIIQHNYMTMHKKRYRWLKRSPRGCRSQYFYGIAFQLGC